jgi:PPOX class probable F420-dependent enzyme
MESRRNIISLLDYHLLDTTEIPMSNAVIPEEFLDLFKKKALAHLATLMPGGEPQVTPVWIDYDGERVIFNTAMGVQKDKNLQRDGRVSLSIADPDNPFRYLEVRGNVTDRTLVGADEHLDLMAKKYMGLDKYPFRQPGEVIVLFKITPEHVTSMS